MPALHAGPLAVFPPLRQSASTQVELREGGGCLSLFGVPFCIAGVVMTLAGLGVLPMQNASGAPWWGRSMLAAMGLAFLAAGGALTFGRRWTIFDAGQGRIIRQWVLVAPSLVLPVRGTTRSLSEFDAVVIAFESDSDAAVTYPVRLRGRIAKDFTVCAPTQFEKSWGLAEFLARFLALNLVDRSTDHELILSPDCVGETLPQRLGSGGARPERVARPMTMRSDVNVEDGTAWIVIPGRRSPAVPAAAAVVGIGIEALLVRPLVQFFRRTDTPAVVQFGCLALLTLVFGILPLLWVVHAVLSAGRRTVVTASRAGILVERHGVWRTHTRSIPAADIVALDYSAIDSMIDSARGAIGQRTTGSGRPVSQFSGSGGSRLFLALKKWVPSKGLIVKSRQGLFVFGEGLPGEELRYLLSVVSWALIGG